MRAEAGYHRKKLTARVDAIDRNHLEQAAALRRHYFPHDNDDEENLARAVWLDNRNWDYMRIAVANGIALAFKGE
ncbi:TPA: DUF6890 family protein [Morganella morganii]|uniref:DUF6890 family protein n=1 Tax=Morganella morganii TaxID=582 RepID=UPI003D672815